MFRKGVMKDPGVDITIKNNPDHVLSPDDWDMVMAARFGKVDREQYKVYYTNLIRRRWEARQSEFMELAKEGIDNDINLKCFCPNKSEVCHAHVAAAFMNNLVERLKKGVK
jgi:hypothetical protein